MSLPTAREEFLGFNVRVISVWRTYIPQYYRVLSFGQNPSVTPGLDDRLSRKAVDLVFGIRDSSSVTQGCEQGSDDRPSTKSPVKIFYFIGKSLRYSLFDTSTHTGLGRRDPPLFLTIQDGGGGFGVLSCPETIHHRCGP